MAEKIKELTNSNSEIVYTDPRKLHGNLFAEAPEKILIVKKVSQP